MSLSQTDLLARTQQAPTSKSVLFDSVVLVLLALLLFGLNADFLLYGDAVVYADYVVLRKFDELTLHLGYYWALYAADLVASGILGVPIWQTMVWLSVVAGSLVLGVSYALARSLLHDRHTALLATLILAISGRVIANATSSEIYMLQTLFVLGAFLLYEHDRALAAGAAAAYALLISPLSAFAFLYFPVREYQRAGGIRWRTSVPMLVAGTLIYLPFLLIHGHELFFGLRGLLVISDIVSPNPLALLANFPKYQFKSFSFMLLLLPAALLAVKKYENFLRVSLAVFIPHLYIIVKLSAEDNVFLLTSDFFFSCWLAIGAVALKDRLTRSWPGMLPIAAHALLFLMSGVVFSFQHHARHFDELRSISDRYLLGRKATLITDWGNAQAVVFAGRPTPTTVIRREPLTSQILDLENVEQSSRKLLDMPEIFLLDGWRPSPLAGFLESESSRRERAVKFSTLSRAQAMFGLQCTLIEEKTGRLHRCTKVTVP